MKKPERMKNKTTKAFLYQNLYPVNLYVTTLDDWEDDFHCSTLAHESIHYADAVYDYLSMNAEGYNEGNEQYAYLVTWCVEQLEDFIECKRKEKRMTRKMTKQDGN